MRQVVLNLNLIKSLKCSTFHIFEAFYLVKYNNGYSRDALFTKDCKGDKSGVPMVVSLKYPNTYLIYWAMPCIHYETFIWIYV